MYRYLDDDGLSGPAMQWENLKHACVPDYTPVEDRYMSENQKLKADMKRRGEAKEAKEREGIEEKVRLDEYGMPDESTVNLLETIGQPKTELNLAEIPKYIWLQVILDSGAGAHVINRKMCPGYVIEESAMSRAGTAFRGADGGKIKNYGQVTLNLLSPDSEGNGHNIASRFEVADVTRALWSVGLITDSGLKVSFSKTNAYVHDQQGKELCVFTRQNGLYVADVKIKNPMHEDFQRREP